MCICHEDGTRHPDDPEGKVRSTWAWTPTGYCNYNGDGYCDESNNIQECNYDEGWCYLKHRIFLTNSDYL